MKKERKKSTFFADFKKFITKGNIMDLAVAVIIGAAFGKIVTSLVNDLLMPLISLIFTAIGLKGFADWKYVITPGDAVNGINEVAINYGNFIQVILDFLIIAFCIFVIFRLITKATGGFNNITKKVFKKNKKGEVVETVEVVPEAPKVPTEAELLTEIRDLLKLQANVQDVAPEVAAAAEEAVKAE